MCFINIKFCHSLYVSLIVKELRSLYNDYFCSRCDKLSGNSGAMSGDSETKFKSSLLRYLQYYEVRIPIVLNFLNFRLNKGYFGSWKENELVGFTVAFLQFLAPALGSNPEVRDNH